ncbi:MAG: PfkB family carbohydrate kinase [Dehalococcoidia bacterium]|nr:PfkB family carbohydrate kinase [Dehalococcoidia bacterium]MDW8119403.1 PfkB family carbohydrate kinase [Chloroflexota bacterium]
MPAPQFLAIGHAVRDRTPRRWRWGGAAVYAALTAARWGVSAALLTAGDRAPSLRGVEVHCKPGPLCTAFENRYQEGGTRRQRLLSRAPLLEPADLPPSWRDASLVLLAPVAQEVSPAFVDCFPKAVIGAALQGWLRHWSGDGVIFPCALASDFPLARLDVLIASQEDVEDPSVFPVWAQKVPLVVKTCGRDGAVLWVRGQAYSVPVVPREEVDPTGAGDVFAATFLLRLWETGSAWEAVRWAAAAGALCVGRVGLAGVPYRCQVARLLATPQWHRLWHG